MSFSGEVKAELCRTPISKKCCAVAESYGILLYCNEFSAKEIRIITENPDFIHRLPKLFKKAFGISFDLFSEQTGKGKQNFIIRDKGKLERIFAGFGYEADKVFAHHINLGVLEDECCQISFVRGAFLAGGSVTDPFKRYHMELTTAHYNVSREVYSVLSELNFQPKNTVRSGNYITYFKNSEQIEDILTKMGAPVAAMSIMSAKIEKDMRNSIQRKVNCDTANVDKVVTASKEQIDAIKILEERIGLENLPDKLQETALLRIANPACQNWRCFLTLLLQSPALITD